MKNINQRKRQVDLIRFGNDLLPEDRRLIGIINAEMFYYVLQHDKYYLYVKLQLKCAFCKCSDKQISSNTYIIYNTCLI